MTRGERVPTTLRDLERVHGKEASAASAEVGRTYRGTVVGYAVEDDGQGYVVLDTGRELTAVPSGRRDLEVGQTVRARAEVAAGQESRTRRALTWAIDDVEHERDRGRGR